MPELPSSQDPLAWRPGAGQWPAQAQARWLEPEPASEPEQQNHRLSEVPGPVVANTQEAQEPDDSAAASWHRQPASNNRASAEQGRSELPADHCSPARGQSSHAEHDSQVTASAEHTWGHDSRAEQRVAHMMVHDSQAA